MLDLSVIILTYNEELHIRRCLENVLPFAKKVFVVDCFSTDKTKEIASHLGAVVVEHAWPGNQAEQFNWVSIPCPGEGALTVTAKTRYSQREAEDAESRACLTGGMVAPP